MVSIKDFTGKHVHIIGICGASLCGLAYILQQQGYEVSGSDMKETIFTPYLRETGVPFTIGHSEANVEGADLVVYSSAVPESNVEYAYAKAHDIPMMDRAELVGQLMLGYKTAIGITGCHGKTTITSMLGLMLLKGGLDPTIHLGGVLDYLGKGGTRLGDGDTMVVEACEYMDNYLKFHPTIALINNIDYDHPDYFKSMEQVEQSFANYAALLPEDGVLFGCADDPKVKALMDASDRQTISFGVKEPADWTASDVEYDAGGCAEFAPVFKGEKLQRVKINLPGSYNVANALGAMAVAVHLGCGMDAVKDALAEYHAAERRFEFHGERDGVKVYHDFAHQPTAVKACMAAAQMMDYKRMWAVFQCNSYSRAHQFFDGFVEAFDPADVVIIAEIFPGREKDTGLVHGQQLADAIKARGKEAHYIPKFEDIGIYLRERWQPGDIVLMVGSGDIDQHVWKILQDQPTRAL